MSGMARHDASISYHIWAARLSAFSRVRPFKLAAFDDRSWLGRYRGVRWHHGRPFRSGDSAAGLILPLVFAPYSYYSYDLTTLRRPLLTMLWSSDRPSTPAFSVPVGSSPSVPSSIFLFLQVLYTIDTTSLPRALSFLLFYRLLRPRFCGCIRFSTSTHPISRL